MQMEIEPIQIQTATIAALFLFWPLFAAIKVVKDSLEIELATVVVA